MGAGSTTPRARFRLMLGSIPELTEPVTDQESDVLADRLAAYMLADGGGMQQIVTRLERLKFETIVRDASVAEVIAGEWP